MITKCTDGYVEQVFSDSGDLISQKFIAGCDSDECEYYCNDETLDSDDPRCNLYAPFDMVQPK